MPKTPVRKPTRTTIIVLHQICNLIPAHLVPSLAKKHGVDKKSRSFTPWSHIVTQLYAQLTHALSLNDICDSLRNHAPKLLRIRSAIAPKRNTLSNANRQRNSAMAEEFFWTMLDRLKRQNTSFGGRTMKGLPRRFKRAVSSIDSSTIALTLNSVDWAKHRRRKAAAKLHLRLDLQSNLPAFAVVDTASHNDNKRARELCAGLKDGEVAVFDKAYVDYDHLSDLDLRGVFWVTRSKSNMKFRVKKRLIKKKAGNILRDDLIVLTGEKSREKYQKPLRRVKAVVTVSGKEREMEFITNNLTWAPSSIADLYKSRWQIEVFFKEIKQTMQLVDFSGYNKNAILWQVWLALTLYVLLRYLKHISKWLGGFKRFFCLLRSSVWDGFEIQSLVEFCGTAGGITSIRLASNQLSIPGFKA
ncbi:MAG: IS4 family transposase [Methylococcaceae bacterium]